MDLLGNPFDFHQELHTCWDLYIVMCRVCLIVGLVVSLVGCQTARRSVQIDSDTRSPRYAVEFTSGGGVSANGEQVADRPKNDVEQVGSAAPSTQPTASKRSRQWPNPLARFIPATVSAPEDVAEKNEVEGREAF